MIQNERQYKVTNGQIKKLKDALQASRTTKKKMDSRVYKAMIAGIESQIKELNDQLLSYDKLKETKSFTYSSVMELPEILIKTRIARGYTQKQLAQKAKIAPQQIQKYEATNYKSANLNRIIEISNALDIKFKGKAALAF
jgi:HTH-type transcriptional regulator/antitoxin HigA